MLFAFSVICFTSDSVDKASLKFQNEGVPALSISTARSDRAEKFALHVTAAGSLEAIHLREARGWREKEERPWGLILSYMVAFTDSTVLA